MAKLVWGRWDYSNNEAVWRRAYSGGEKDEFETCKILGQTDEFDKSGATCDLQVS